MTVLLDSTGTGGILTPFNFHRNLSQGRIEDSNASDGSYIFELGHRGNGDAGANWFGLGDYSEVSQEIIHDSTELLTRVTVRVVEPNDPNSVLAWDLVGLLDGGEFYRRRLQPLGRTLTLTDIALSLAGVTTPTTIAFRLISVAA